MRAHVPALTVLVAFAIGLSVVSCSDDGEPAAATLIPRPCAADERAALEVTCHWLVLPGADADRGDGETRLAVAVIASPAPEPVDDPVVVLTGGPGQAGTVDAGFWATQPITQLRDVIVYDIRGVGRSTPSLDCPEQRAAVARNLGRAALPTEESATIRAAAEACATRLRDAGMDLDQSDTLVNVADLEALRRALGVERWNLLGRSYGTRLALAALRDPDAAAHVRSVVLDSTYPTTVGGPAHMVASAERAFAVLFDACAAQPSCRSAHGDLRAHLEEIIDWLDRTPARVEIDLGPDDGGVIRLAVSGADVVAGLFSALYDSAVLPALPRVLALLAEGDTSVISLFARQLVPALTGLAEGAFYGVDCADSGRRFGDRPDDRALLEDPGRWSVLLDSTSAVACPVWPVDALPESFNEPVTSDVPTLVLGGSFDPVTPPADGRAAAETLANVTVVEVPASGHGVLGVSSCVDLATAAFLTVPEARVDTSCLADEPGVVFD